MLNNFFYDIDVVQWATLLQSFEKSPVILSDRPVLNFKLKLKIEFFLKLT